MAKLIIYRGETQIAQVTLTGKALKLGRGKDNDVVLEDPGKGVSRVHAELRPEGDRYRLVDLQSQNGTWVSGTRVPSVVLAPGVVAAMGPFRIAVDAASPLTQPFAVVTPETVSETGTEFSRPVASLPPPPPPPQAPEPVAVDGAGALLDDLSPDGRTVPAVHALESTPVPDAAVQEAPAAPPATKGGHDTASRPGQGSRTAMLTVAAVLTIAACGFGAYKLLLRKPAPAPVWDAAAATALTDSGRCQEALERHINPALALDPNNAAALTLKAKCSAAPPVPEPKTVAPPPVVTRTNAQKLDEAESSLLANACQAAFDTANEVLTADANDERAQGLVKKANDCLHPAPLPPPPATAAGDALVKIAPAQGGLEPLQGETGRDYKARVAALRKRYEDAVALLENQKYQQAAKEFETIAGQVPAGYMDLAQRRADARTGMREESGRAYTAAKTAEQRSDWNTAFTQYQRAHDLDPARDVAADIARITEVKAKIGHQLCAEAEVAYAIAHNSDAADKYARVLELLPSSDPCYVKAKDQLAKLRR